MQIKQLNWHPYAYNHDQYKLYQVAYVYSADDIPLFSYLIMTHGKNSEVETYSLIIAGMSPGVKFNSIQEAKDYCQTHFENFFKTYVTKIKEAA